MCIMAGRPNNLATGASRANAAVLMYTTSDGLLRKSAVVQINRFNSHAPRRTERYSRRKTGSGAFRTVQPCSSSFAVRRRPHS